MSNPLRDAYEVKVWLEKNAAKLTDISNAGVLTVEEKGALAGISGTPSSSNRFATAIDLANKSDVGHSHAGVYEPVKGADDNFVTDTEKANLHAPGSDNQDLSGKADVGHSHSPTDITGTAVVTNDARLSDARTPLAHTHTGTYEPADSAIQSHIQSTHAPSNAEQNVNADWNAGSGDAQILNKPTTMTPTSHGNEAHSSTFIVAADAVAPNTAITGATKTKVTYDTKGLITSGADATTADIADSTDRRYCTDAQKTVIGNTSGTNTGDNSANSSTHYVGTTAIACNRASATQSLTGITSIDGSAATLTTARNIGGRAFNGSADIVSPTWKTGITTRDITTASGTVNVAHGLGRVPSFVRVTASLISSASVSQECEGSYDGTNHAGLCTIQSEGTSTALIDTIYSSTAFELGFSAATVVNPYTGANRQTATITVDATNIIFTWTKTGTVASAVANIKWECT